MPNLLILISMIFCNNYYYGLIIWGWGVSRVRGIGAYSPVEGFTAPSVKYNIINKEYTMIKQ